MLHTRLRSENHSVHVKARMQGSASRAKDCNENLENDLKKHKDDPLSRYDATKPREYSSIKPRDAFSLECLADAIPCRIILLMCKHALHAGLEHIKRLVP